MARPSSAKGGGGLRPATANPKLMQQNGNLVSYEDMLVAQYLEELRKSPPYTKSGHQGPTSPYLQKLAHTHIVPTSNQSKQRPFSATTVSSTGKPKIDPKFIADPNLWDPATPRNLDGYRPLSKRKKRPISAPVYRRPYSGAFGSRPSSAKFSVIGGKKVKSLYKRQPHTIVVTAFKNGDREIYAKVAAPSIKVLLEYCTEKLGLPMAARRMYLADGTEVFTASEIPRDAEVYIACSENFKDPLKPVKKQNEMSKSASWTMNGLILSQDARQKSTKPRLSKRFRSTIEQNRRRVLVFKNGHGSQGVEIVADPERFEDFLVACTAKLDMGSYARVLYDWEGNEVSNLDDAPVLDQCLQTWSTPVLGPLWVSKNEGFSPKGVCEFLDGLITYTRGKLREAKHYKEQLQLGQDEATKDRVDIVAILSMSSKEIDETLDIVARDIDDFSNALNRLKKQKSKIEENVKEEQDEGYEYTLKHIGKIEANHRMVGTRGIRLKVYENGSFEDETVIYFNLQQAIRGIGNDREQLMERLLDQCSGSSCLANPKHNPAIGPMAKKVFNNLGHEIKNVFDLQYDQDIWLSFGENWKNPFTYVMSAVFDKMSAYDIESRRTGVREQLMQEDLHGRDRPGCWETVMGIPDDMTVKEVNSSTDPMEKEHVMSLIDHGEIEPASTTFLQAKNKSDLLLFGEVTVDTKKKKGKDVWPADAQIWVVSKNGYIYCKGMPQLVLGVSEQRVCTNLGHPFLGQSDVKVEGFAVSLQKKESSAAQEWHFTAEGQIYSALHPELFLTFLGSQYNNEESKVHNEVEGIPSGYGFYVAVCQKIDGKQSKSQRWALKQERLDNLGQWKLTKAENPEWSKQALSWPVTETGELNETFDWPMEGFMLPYAPPLKKAGEKKSTSVAPARLLVLKNGEKEVAKAVAVVGPDLSNMKKDSEQSKKRRKKKKSQTGRDYDTESIDVDMPLHCDGDVTILKLELIMFLERATSMLGLPFAARRLYDSTGKEHFSLRSLERDQLVYVTCGETWSDPNLSKAEQQRRYLLANLASDVTQIRQFVALRSPQNLVLEVDSLSVGAPVSVNESALMAKEVGDTATPQKSVEISHSDEMVEDSDLFNGRMGKESKSKSAHEISHQRADERHNNLKWPWERVAGGDGDQDVDEEEKNFTNPELFRKFRQKPRRQVDQALQLQKFMFEDGYIMCANNRSLVLGVNGEQEDREVVVVKQRPDDIFQLWTLADNGVIQAKHNPQMVLTVSMPSHPGGSTNPGQFRSYLGSQVTLQQRKSSQFGRANQRWYHDKLTGFLQAFHTDAMDKEITAANKANVCTFSVMGATEVDQPGYVVEMQSDKSGKPKTLLVCSSCARAMRGRHKLERVPGNVDFACSMGNAKMLGVRQIGSFQCLNGKVDLSTYEAEHTLEEWEGQLEKLREELSVRAIAKEISAARVPYTVKVTAYKNGEGRMKPGELVVGSSIPGILEQCTSRLELARAARRLYTSDGVIIMDVDDLVEWVTEEYVKDARKQMRQEAKAKKLASGQGSDKGGGRRSSLMDKVQLDSEESGDDDEEEEEEDGEEAAPAVVVQEENYLIGQEASQPRSIIDPASWKGVVMIPNSTEELGEDGVISQWQVYTTREGMTKLLVFRPDPDNLNTYTVVGTSTCESVSAGCNTISIKPEHQIPTIKGDVIGFHFVDNPLIPYEIDKEMNEAPLYKKIIGEPPEVGAVLKMNAYKQNGSRKYAFNATITVRREVEQAAPAVVPSRRKKDKKRSKREKLPYIEPPPVDMVLRYPIEVWISCGEGFVKPEVVEKSYEMNQEQREERASVAYELEKEKHVLRQMQGRRYEGQRPAHYRATRNPLRPVLMAGHWQEPSTGELHKHDIVHQLETHLHELKSSQKPKGVKTYNAKSVQRLYTQPSMKRLLVFPNGEKVERAVYVWGETIQQLLDNSTSRLNLRKPGKFIYDLNGTLLQDFDEIDRDQLVCVSSNKTFLQPRESQQLIEIKANWGRARRQYGPQATDIVVQAQTNPEVDVDAFGPSHLAGGSPQAPGTAGRVQSSNRARSKGH